MAKHYILLNKKAYQTKRNPTDFSVGFFLLFLITYLNQANLDSEKRSG